MVFCPWKLILLKILEYNNDAYHLLKYLAYIPGTIVDILHNFYFT